MYPSDICAGLMVRISVSKLPAGLLLQLCGSFGSWGRGVTPSLTLQVTSGQPGQCNHSGGAK